MTNYKALFSSLLVICTVAWLGVQNAVAGPHADEAKKHASTALKHGEEMLDSGADMHAFVMHAQAAIKHAQEAVRPFLQAADTVSLPFQDHSFDLVISINTLHNLYCYELEKALKEIERVGKRHKYIVVESYRNLEEKTNLMYWVLTGECFFTPKEWEWWFDLCGYTGDHSFIYFE